MTNSESLLDKLPSSWVVTQIGEILDYGSAAKAEPAEIPMDAWVLELEDIERDTSRLLDRLTFAERQSKSTKNRFEAGDVLYGKLRPYLNKVLIADQEGYCSTEILPLRVGDQIDSRFLFYWLKSPGFLSYVEAKSHGMDMPRLGTDSGKAAPLLLAPRPEQSRIADKLDAIFTRVSACRDRLDRLPAILSSYRQAVLTAAVRGDLTGGDTSYLDGKEDHIAPKNWKKETIGAVTVDLRYGTSKKCDYPPNGVGVLRIPNIGEHGRISIEDMKWAKFDQSETEKLALRSGDLLIIRSNGSVDLVGRTSIVTEREEGFLFAGYLMRLRVDTQKVLPKFIQVCLSTPEQRQRITVARKSTSGVNNINATEIRALPIAYPTIEEQTEIVRRVESLFTLADRIEARHAAARKQVEGLIPTLLAKAFRGELVPQDNRDEPASMLLARIAATRAATQTMPRTRKTSPRKATRTSKEKSAMTKSRQDDDVKEKPYLADHLRRLGGNAHAEALFKAADLPVADFYKQLAWEVQQGLVLDGKTKLELPDAAR